MVGDGADCQMLQSAEAMVSGLAADPRHGQNTVGTDAPSPTGRLPTWACPFAKLG